MAALLSRRLIGGLLAVALAAVGVALLVGALRGSDSANLAAVAGPGASQADAGDAHLAPGTPDPIYPSDPPTSGAHVVRAVTRDDVPLSDDELLTALELGDVVLAYGRRTDERPLAALADRLAGPFDPSLAASGEAVILDPLPSVAGTTALAWRHELHAASPTDPALASFATFWLGRGAQG